MMSDLRTLLAGFFQVAYVTSDIDRAKRDLSDRFAIDAVVDLPSEIEVEEGGEKGIMRAHAFLAGTGGGPVLEVLQPIGGFGTLLTTMLDGCSGYVTRVHHLGTRVPDIDRLRESLRGAGRDFFQYGELPGVRAGFIDLRPELGHFIEALELTDESWAMIQGLRA